VLLTTSISVVPEPKKKDNQETKPSTTSRKGNCSTLFKRAEVTGGRRTEERGGELCDMLLGVTEGEFFEKEELASAPWVRKTYGGLTYCKKRVGNYQKRKK